MSTVSYSENASKLATVNNESTPTGLKTNVGVVERTVSSIGNNNSGTIDKIADLLDFGTSPENHGVFWQYSIQGEYCVVNSNLSKLVSENGWPTSDVFEKTGLTEKNFQSLFENTATVVHIPSMRVVKRGLNDISNAVVDIFDNISTRFAFFNETGEHVKTSYSSLFDMKTTRVDLWEDIESVTYHPKIEGACVYIWKHNGEVFFSTKRKVTALNSRWGDSRLFSEIYASLGGPSSLELFPDLDDLDGGGVSFAFLIVHPSLFKTTKMEVGNGYLMFIGATCAYTGNEVDILNSPRVKWQHADEIRDPSVNRFKAEERERGFSLKIVGESSLSSSSSGSTDATTTNNNDVVLDNLVTEKLISMIDKSLLCEEICMREGVWSPYPPPSRYAFPFKPKGNANEIARGSFFSAPRTGSISYSNGNDDGCFGEAVSANNDLLLPSPVFASPNLNSYEASVHFKVGFLGNVFPDMVRNGKGLVDKCHLDEFDSAFPGSNLKFLAENGEPLIIRIKFKTGKVHLYTSTPLCYLWKRDIVGNNPNPSHRAGEFRTMVNDALTGSEQFALEFKNLIPSCPFKTSLHCETIISWMIEYIHRESGGSGGVGDVGGGAVVPSFEDSNAPIITEGVYKFFCKELIKHEKLLESFSSASKEAVSPEREETKRLFAWTCIVLAITSPPSIQLDALNAYQKFSRMEKSVSTYLQKIYSPLVKFTLLQASKVRSSKGIGGSKFTNSSTSSSLKNENFHEFENTPSFKKKDGTLLKITDDIRNLVFEIRKMLPRSTSSSCSESTAISNLSDEVVMKCDGQKLYSIAKAIGSVF